VNYKKPTLVEIYTELFFSREFLTPEKFFDIVPKIKEIGMGTVEVGQPLMVRGETIKGDNIEQQIAPTPRVRCWNSDKSQLVQLSQDLLVVNLVGNYPGWEEYRSLFDSILDKLRALSPTLKVKALALHTIDKFSRPQKDFELSDYLNVGGPLIPSWYKSAKTPLDITLGKGFLEADGFNEQFRCSLRRGPENFDLKATTAFKKMISSGEEITTVLEDLHADSTRCFESWITDKTRGEVMGGAE